MDCSPTLFDNDVFVFRFTIVCSHFRIHHTQGGLFDVKLQVGRDYFGCEHVRTIMLNSLFGAPVMYVYVCLLS